MIGEKFGHYRIKNRLGNGGMGDVYLAEEQKTYFTREVVLKLVKDELNQAGKSRFLDEMRMLASLEHENIARMYDGGSEDGRLFIAMEYVRSGVNLRQYMLDPQTGKQVALPLDQVLSITKQACEGLDAAHKKGIIHRDLKPENIIVIPEEGRLRVKIIDFGIAASIAPGVLPEPDRQLTQGICGTPHYLSPEQAAGKNRSEIDHRSDIYSLGLVVYEMLTGVLAFQGNFVSLLRLHQENDPHPITQLRPQLGPQLGPAINAVVMKALKKYPEQRPPDMKAFAREFEATIHRRETPRDVPPVPQRPVPVYKPWSFGRWILLAMVAIIIVTISFFALLVSQALINNRSNSSQSSAANSPIVRPAPISAQNSAAPARTKSALADAAKIVGSWRLKVRENGTPVQLSIQFNSDGTSIYKIITTQESSYAGKWSYSEGVLSEQYPDNTVSKGRLRWIDDNHVELTILSNGNPTDTGKKRQYYRLTSGY
jgi:serine/threonine protein kinase